MLAAEKTGRNINPKMIIKLSLNKEESYRESKQADFTRESKFLGPGLTVFIVFLLD